ncbi:MAG: 1-phosphofructokinase family hexose kinase, partial [Promethearchaeia archaeon]
MIYTVTLNPAVDRTIELDHIKLGGLNRVKSTRLDASGKGINVSRVIHSLGGESIALGFLGGKNGLFIYEKIQELGIREAFIRIQNSTRMNIKVLENETKQVTEFNEKGPVIKDNEINELKRLLKENVKNEDFIIFSGSVPKNIPDSIYRELIQLLPREVKTILDSDGPLLKEGIKASPFLIKTNLGEFCRLTGIQSENFAQISA